MKLTVKVIPGSKIAQVQKGIDGNLKIWLKSKPVDGKANKELIDTLADYFCVRKYQVIIISGLTSREKIIKINKEG